MVELREYVTREGKSPFADWFDSLDTLAALKVNTFLTRIGEGNLSALKPLSGAFQELRIDWGPGYRVYVGRDRDTLIVLLGGGTKKHQRRDIDRARVLWREYKIRKKESKLK